MTKNRLKDFVVKLFIILLFIPQGLSIQDIKAAKEPTQTLAQNNFTEIVTHYHETFESGLGAIQPTGDAQVDLVSEQNFIGNDNGEAILISERTSTGDGVRLNFNDIGIEEGGTYQITIIGFVDADQDVSDHAQVYLEAVPSPNLVAKTHFISGEPFILTGQYRADRNEDTMLQLNTNQAGQAVSFYLGSVLITEVTTDDQTGGVDQEHSHTEPFTIIDFEDQSTGGFEPRAQTEILTVTDEANHTEGGSYALKIEGRTENWHGPSLRVDPFIEQGQEYYISAWVKLISPISAELQLSTQIGSGNNASYNNIQSKVVREADGWVQLEGSYRYHSTGDEYVTIYIESPDSSSASFYLDDITFKRIESEGIEIDPDLPPLKEVYQDYFLIGNAVSLNQFEGATLEQLNLHYNLVTAENAMKPAYVYNDNREFDFTSSDALVDRALAEGMQVHGHVLIWHQQSPEWLHTDENGQPLSREEALANLRHHVKTVVEHYGEKVMSWDVVNEAINDNPQNPSNWRGALRQSGWYRAIGEDYLAEAFRAAKEVIDENDWKIKLYYNDYNDDNQNKAEAIYHMVKEINESYAAEHNGERLIDGIGMQGHYNLHTNPENVRRSLEKFISLDVEVGITELDVTAGEDYLLTEEQAIAQGYLYAQLFKLYREHAEHISRVTFWGLNDASSWRASQNPQLFDRNLQPKPAYYAVIDPDQFIEDHKPEEQEPNHGIVIFGTPIIDGNMDDIWLEAPVLPINRYQMAWQGANGTARVLWDDEHLYVFIEVNDLELDKSSENPWEQDSIEVFIDENNAKTTFYQDDDGQYRVNFDNEISFNPVDIEAGFESATQVTENGYQVEVKIPFRTINANHGTTIGFDMQINDARDGSRQSIATWNDITGNAFQDTSVFGVLTLAHSLDEEEELTIDQNERVMVDAGQKIRIKQTQISIDMPTDLPKGTEILVKVLNQVATPRSTSGRKLTKAGDVVEIRMIYPKDSQDYIGTFNLTLGYQDQYDTAAVYYLNDETDRWQWQGGKKNSEDNTIILNVSGFSSYGVFADIDTESKISELKEMLALLINRIEQLKGVGADVAELEKLLAQLEIDIKQLTINDSDRESLVTDLLQRMAELEAKVAEQEHKMESSTPKNNDQHLDDPSTGTTDKNDQNQTGYRLPNTATTLYHFLISGVSILLVGAVLLILHKRKAKG